MLIHHNLADSQGFYTAFQAIRTRLESTLGPYPTCQPFHSKQLKLGLEETRKRDAAPCLIQNASEMPPGERRLRAKERAARQLGAAQNFLRNVVQERFALPFLCFVSSATSPYATCKPCSLAFAMEGGLSGCHLEGFVKPPRVPLGLKRSIGRLDISFGWMKGSAASTVATIIYGPDDLEA